MQENIEQSWLKTFSRVLWISGWGEGLHFNKTKTQSNPPRKHRSGSVKVLVWPSQSPDMNSISILKMAVHGRSPSNLVELKRFSQKECEKLPKERCAKRVGWFPRRPEAVIAANCTLAKYSLKGMNSLLFFINLQNTPKTSLCFVIVENCV